MELTAPAVRVLAALVEKALATPQHYPLSLNALVAACNQTTNRDPVVAYDSSEVRAALDELRDGQLISTEYARGGRTPKYCHELDHHFELDAPDVALLGMLMLRGPQTSGELRTRVERLHPFDSVVDVEDTLEAMAVHHYGPFTRRLDRQPGQKEARWTHLLGGAVAPGTSPAPTAIEGALEEEVAQLRAKVDQLDERLTAVEQRHSDP